MALNFQMALGWQEERPEGKTSQSPLGDSETMTRRKKILKEKEGTINTESEGGKDKPRQRCWSLKPRKPERSR